MISADHILKLSEEISFQSLGENEGGVILELQDGQLHTCNDTTVAFLNLLDGHRTIAQIATKMSEEFEVQDDVLIVDLQELSSKLLKEGIIV
jgi:pyrroloquinoline quinone biosynthesis protein D